MSGFILSKHVKAISHIILLFSVTDTGMSSNFNPLLRNVVKWSDTL